MEKLKVPLIESDCDKGYKGSVYYFTCQCFDYERHLMKVIQETRRAH
jgi:hypothetical protein